MNPLTFLSSHEDYYTIPSAGELIAREKAEQGHTSRVTDFIIGRLGFGQVRFYGETDIRNLDIGKNIQFNCCQIEVYPDEKSKPPIGKCLNKPAEVTLIIPSEMGFLGLKDTLRKINKKQGADFLSYDEISREWKFTVPHFSRFGLFDDEEVEDDEESRVLEGFRVSGSDVRMEENEEDGLSMEVEKEDGRRDLMVLDNYEGGKAFRGSSSSVLSHSLPEHLGLDPVKMHEMRIVFLEEEEIDIDNPRKNQNQNHRKMHAKDPQSQAQSQPQPQHIGNKRVTWRSPEVQAIGYFGNDKVSNSPREPPLHIYNNPSFDTMVAKQSMDRVSPIKRTKATGFQLGDEKVDCPVSKHLRNVVDSALFMGKSFRVGWGPNGMFVHCGKPVGHTEFSGLSSVVHIENAAIDRTVRAEDGEVKKELIDLQFILPLRLHMSMSKIAEHEEGFSSCLKLRSVEWSRDELRSICTGYGELIEKQVGLDGVSTYRHILLMQQLLVWDLIKVLFEDKMKKYETAVENEGVRGVDPEAVPLMRRAAFSSWLQESVEHRVQREIKSMEEGDDLKQVFSLLSGMQLEEAIQIAAYRGDVRLACLISQAGGHTINREFMADQLDSWVSDGMDFNFIEEDRMKLFKLLSGNINGALEGVSIDWKRYLGLLMWFHLAPDSDLPTIISFFATLVRDGVAPAPVPLYIDEGPLPEVSGLDVRYEYDLTYHIMLLHANGKDNIDLKKMFSAFSSTYDALDYHMTWHQQSILHAIGALDSQELHLMYMSFVSQLLCVGECQWAIYVVLHLPLSPSFSIMHEKIIREILFQYCEIWSSSEDQKQFIQELGVPSEWMHEAQAIYYKYTGDHKNALEHLLKSSQWQKAHTLFVTEVAPLLFCSSKHTEIWRLSNILEGKKSEIADWDLGAGIYLKYYLLQDEFKNNETTNAKETLENRSSECREFFVCLNQSSGLWKGKLSLNARVAYSKMSDNVASWLSSETKECRDSLGLQMDCYNTVLDAPVPEDLRMCRLQDAVSVFTSWINEIS